MLTKQEIVKLFYGDDNQALEPDFNWKVNVEAFGINPDKYIVEKSSNDVVNVNELYNALLLEEIKTLKESLSYYKEKIFGSNKLSNYMIAPKSSDIHGNPQNRDEVYYFKKLSKSKLKESIIKEHCRMFSLGDTVQPINTEILIKQYVNDEKIMPDVEMVNKLTEWQITTHEWERAIVIKELLILQKELSQEIKNNSEIFITDLMPKKYVYGQNIIYNKSSNKFCRNGEWITLNSKR